MTTEKFDLVLGSKPCSSLPQAPIRNIYTANGAASQALIYKDQADKIISIIASGQSSDQSVINSIIKAKPNKIIMRKSGADPELIFSPHLPDCCYETYTNREQLNLQKHFFGRLVLLDLLAPTGNKQRLKRFINFLLQRHIPFGISTGVWAILYALHQDSEMKILVSGVGLQEGSHAYGKGYFKNETARKDRWLVPRIPKAYRDRIYTTDYFFSQHANVHYWDKGTYPV